eukprot:764865-Hanusia_phi.AAC.3
MIVTSTTSAMRSTTPSEFVWWRDTGGGGFVWWRNGVGVGRRQDSLRLRDASGNWLGWLRCYGAVNHDNKQPCLVRALRGPLAMLKHSCCLLTGRFLPPQAAESRVEAGGVLPCLSLFVLIRHQVEWNQGLGKTIDWYCLLSSSFFSSPPLLVVFPTPTLSLSFPPYPPRPSASPSSCSYLLLVQVQVAQGQLLAGLRGGARPPSRSRPIERVCDLRRGKQLRPAC